MRVCFTPRILGRPRRTCQWTAKWTAPPASPYIPPAIGPACADLVAARPWLEVAMGLSGTLGTFPLADLLQWMSASRKTGTLRVHGDRHTRTVHIKEGRIVSSAS